MKDVIFRKGLVCAVIFLFIGLAFVPIVSSNITKTISGNESAEFIVQACGVKGVKPKIVRLTNQQVSKLDNYMDSLKSRLENATTDDEVTNILNGAVIELNKYGLLPEHMSVEKAQQLVVNKYKNQVATSSEDKENFNCQIVGKTDGQRYFDNQTPLRKKLWEMILSFIDRVENLGLLIILVSLIYARVGTLIIRSIFFCLIRDAKLSFGYYDSYFNPETWEEWEKYVPGSGWVWTNGSNGIVTWDGNLWGLISKYWVNIFLYEDICYFIGAEDFTGIRIISLSDGMDYFFGSASHVKLGPNRPPWS